MPLDDRPRACWIVGAAIETIVWSMKVIATAKIIAVRIRLRERPPALAVLLWLIEFLLHQDEAACGRSSPTGRSWGALHRGVPELLDGRVDQLVIARQLCLDGPGSLVGEHLDLAGLDSVEDLLGD